MQFPETQWSLLAQATLHGDTASARALAEFCERYRPPVLAFLRRRGYATPDAEDLTQQFFLHLMDQSTLRRADATRGRFRSFLLGALQRLLAAERERQHAAKRGGGVAPLRLEDDEVNDSRIALPPADVAEFDREWATGLLKLALSALESEYAERGRTEHFDVLRAFVLGGDRHSTYAEAAERLGQSPAAIKSEVHRLRKRFRACLRREIALTLSSPEDLDAEVAYLGRVLRQSMAT